jgi:tRNA-uridine 2-sulfurtransferase
MPVSPVGVALSGGVDSTVCAALLKEEGHAVHGFFMQLPLNNLAQQERQVARVASRLDIPLTMVDLRTAFRRQVIEHFIGQYAAGLTPNPCVHCNHTIKLGALMEVMLAHGMHRMATGHYARVHDAPTSTLLCRGIDPAKDQSYFLCRLSHEQRQRLLLPLGRWHKSEVFARASAQGLSFAQGESQDICFLDQPLATFLAAHGMVARPGPIIGPDNSPLGQHRGSWRYTIGQRRGLGLPDRTPWYVTGIDGANNVVRVGKEADLYADTLVLGSVQWHQEPVKRSWQGLVQLRSRHRAALATATSLPDGRWRLHFPTPQRAITPGQYAVFYQEDCVVGSGVILETTEAA